MRKMIKIEIKNRFTGSVLFEYSKENNTIKETLLQALKENAYLRNADLRYADLSNADLSNADLRYADLSNADLSNAYLRYADLSNANLSNAYLRNAYLINADLSNAKNKEQACLPIFCKWSHCIIGNKIGIGCKEKTIEEWEVFFGSNEEYETSRNSEDFKQIQAVFEAYKGYLTFLNK